MTEIIGANSSFPLFAVQKADLSIDVAFSGRLWQLVHNIPALHSALLDRMAEFGVGSRNLRYDTGDGSVGGHSLQFWMLDFQAHVTIRLESLELQFSNFSEGDAALSERVLETLLQAIDAASEHLVKPAHFTVTTNSHGDLSGKAVDKFLLEFVRPPKDMTATAAGVVFYFGEESPSQLSAVTVDLSAKLPGKLYLKIHAAFPGNLSTNQLRTAFEAQVARRFLNLGLGRP